MAALSSRSGIGNFSYKETDHKCVSRRESCRLCCNYSLVIIERAIDSPKIHERVHVSKKFSLWTLEFEFHASFMFNETLPLLIISSHVQR